MILPDELFSGCVTLNESFIQSSASNGWNQVLNVPFILIASVIHYSVSDLPRKDSLCCERSGKEHWILICDDMLQGVLVHQSKSFGHL